MSKKIELKVHMICCERYKTTIWKSVATAAGVNSISLDAEKGVLTVTGCADAVEIVEKLRKAKVDAEIISLGPEKKEEKKEEKKDDKKDEKKEDEKKDDGKKDEEKKDKIECVTICYCNCRPCQCHYKQAYGCPPAYYGPAYGYGYGMPQVVYYEQYPRAIVSFPNSACQ